MNSGNKKILISVIAFVAVIAILTGGLFALKNSENKPVENTTGSYDYDAEVSTDAVFSEVATSAIVTTSPAMQGYDIDKDELAIIQAYVSGIYYIDGRMYADNTVSELEIALSGHNFHTTMDMEGTEMGIMYLNDDVYIINEAEKKYMSFSSLMSLVGEGADFDMSELKEVAEAMDMTKYNFTDFEAYQDTYKSQDSTCYKYSNTDYSLIFVFTEGELRQIDFGSAEGDVATSVEIDTFLPYIPSGMLTLRGLQLATIFDFVDEEMFAQ